MVALFTEHNNAVLRYYYQRQRVRLRIKNKNILKNQNKLIIQDPTKNSIPTKIKAKSPHTHQNETTRNMTKQEKEWDRIPCPAGQQNFNPNSKREDSKEIFSPKYMYIRNNKQRFRIKKLKLYI